MICSRTWRSSSSRFLLSLIVLAAADFALAKEPENAPIAEKTVEQYWDESGVNFEMLSPGQVENLQCISSEVFYRACWKAVSRVAGLAKPGLEVLPRDLLLDPNFIHGEVLQDLGAGLVLLKAAKLTGDYPSLRARNEASRAREQNIEKALLARHQGELGPTNQGELGPTDQGKIALTDFEGILKFLVNEKISPERQSLVLGEGISAFLSIVVDAHARITPRELLKHEASKSSSSFSGIGAFIRRVGAVLIFDPVKRGGPAYKAGLRSKDVILKIDDQPVGDRSADEVAKILRGPKGSQVKVQASRQQQEKNFVVIRDQIVEKNVQVRVQKFWGTKLLVLKLVSFAKDNVCVEIRNKVSEVLARDKKIKGLVFDLRGNGGGFLGASICVGGLFVGPKVIVRVQDLDERRSSELASSESAVTDLPMVTLIDEGSASASEIVAGALQDYQRSWIVGERSFGKATVQNGTELVNHSLILIFETIQRFFQPLGSTNQLVGIQPDFEVPATWGATEDDRFAFREADLFPNALPATGRTWTQPRPQDVARVQSCRSNQKAERLVAKELSHNEEPDYQLAVAAEVLVCDFSSTDRATSQVGIGSHEAR